VPLLLFVIGVVGFDKGLFKIFHFYHTVALAAGYPSLQKCLVARFPPHKAAAFLLVHAVHQHKSARILFCPVDTIASRTARTWKLPSEITYPKYHFSNDFLLNYDTYYDTFHHIFRTSVKKVIFCNILESYLEE
jgi:hypothetical protein